MPLKRWEDRLVTRGFFYVNLCKIDIKKSYVKHGLSMDTCSGHYVNTGLYTMKCINIIIQA